MFLFFVLFIFCLFLFCIGFFSLHGFRSKTLEWFLPLEEYMVHIDEVIKIQDIAVSKMMSILIKIYKILLAVQGHVEWK